MNHSPLLLLLLAVGMIAWGLRAEVEDSADLELAREMAVKLAKVGYTVDLSKVEVTTEAEEKRLRDFRRQQAVWFAPTHYEGMARFLSALGLPGATDGAALENATA